MTTLSMHAAIHDALDEALAADDRVILLGEDIADPGGGIAGVTAGLSTKHGRDRVLDTPISEAAIAGAAIGAALDGLLPVAEIMIMDFIGIALDQIVNVAAKARFTSSGRTPCPVTIRTATFGGLGSGATHSQSLEAWFMHVPGLKVIMPGTPADAKGLLKAAIFDPDPCLFIETTIMNGVVGDAPPPGHVVEIGRADIKRSGDAVTVITYGRALQDTMQAAEVLAGEGIDIEIVDLRTLVPLDLDTVLQSVRRTGRAVIAHYATTFAGPGAELAATISSELFGELKAPVARVGARYRPIPALGLDRAVLPNAERVAESVRAVAKQG